MKGKQTVNIQVSCISLGQKWVPTGISTYKSHILCICLIYSHNKNRDTQTYEVMIFFLLWIYGVFPRQHLPLWAVEPRDRNLIKSCVSRSQRHHSFHHSNPVQMKRKIRWAFSGCDICLTKNLPISYNKSTKKWTGRPPIIRVGSVEKGIMHWLD